MKNISRYTVMPLLLIMAFTIMTYAHVKCDLAPATNQSQSAVAVLQDDTTIAIGHTIGTLPTTHLGDLTYIGFNSSGVEKWMCADMGTGEDSLVGFYSGTWKVWNKDDGLYSFSWGTFGDLPNTGDFNGDGISDFAVYRPSNGYWYILNGADLSTGWVFQWGTSGDRPLMGDLNGDGKDEAIQFRISNGYWYSIDINANGGSYYHPEPGNTPFAAPIIMDYNGDGTDDTVFYGVDGGPSTTQGLGLYSTWEYTDVCHCYANFEYSIGIQHYGSYIAAPADYNGNGTEDFAEYNPATGRLDFLDRVDGDYKNFITDYISPITTGGRPVQSYRLR